MRKYQKYDVIVIGGGAAGIAAALGVVKTGGTCVLIERNGCLGGQATNSNVASYCGFFTHEKMPRQVVKGVGQEVLEELKFLDGYNSYSFSSIGNAIITFDEELLKYALDVLVQKYELDVMFHCSLVKVNTSGDGTKIDSVECIDDENWYEFEGKAYVDASGDANLSYLAGAKIRYGDGQGGGYFSTKVMRIDRVKPEVKFSQSILEQVIRKAKAEGYTHLTKEAGIIFHTEADIVYAILPSIAVPKLDSRTLTRCEMETRRQCQEYMEVFRKYMPGMENARLLSTGNKIGLRDTRHVIGEEILTANDVLNAQKRTDRVARGAWPCEMHDDICTMISYLWIKDDGYYDIPLGTLKSINIKNLWCAGRCISADPIAFASVRVMGIGFATGQAAGVAAAFYATCGWKNVQIIQKELEKQGAGILEEP